MAPVSAVVIYSPNNKYTSYKWRMHSVKNLIRGLNFLAHLNAHIDSSPAPPVSSGSLK